MKDIIHKQAGMRLIFKVVSSGKSRFDLQIGVR